MNSLDRALDRDLRPVPGCGPGMREGEVRFEVGPGIHTVRGRAADCAPDGRPVRLLLAGEHGRPAPLDVSLEPDDLRARRVFPFITTFFVSRRRELRLTSTGRRPTWAGLRLESEPSPAIRPVADQGPMSDVGARPRRAGISRMPDGAYRLADWGWASARGGYGPIEVDHANGEHTGGDGVPLRVRGRTYAHGVGAHAPGVIWVFLGGGCSRFRTLVAVDDYAHDPASVRLAVRADGRLLATTEVLRRDDPAPVVVDVALTGRRWLRLDLLTTPDGNEDDAIDLLEPRLYCP